VLIGLAESDPEAQARVKALQQGLGQLGWTDGRNLRIEFRWAGSDIGRIRAYAVELVAMKPDAILAQAPRITAAVQQETRTIPIVFINVPDPVETGLNLERIQRALGIKRRVHTSCPDFETLVQSLKSNAPVAEAITCTAKTRNLLGHYLAWAATSLSGTLPVAPAPAIAVASDVILAASGGHSGPLLEETRTIPIVFAQNARSGWCRLRRHRRARQIRATHE
jgi:hypothetical protein